MHGISEGFRFAPVGPVAVGQEHEAGFHLHPNSIPLRKDASEIAIRLEEPLPLPLPYVDGWMMFYGSSPCKAKEPSATDATHVFLPKSLGKL